MFTIFKASRLRWAIALAHYSAPENHIRIKEHGNVRTCARSVTVGSTLHHSQRIEHRRIIAEYSWVQSRQFWVCDWAWSSLIVIGVNCHAQPWYSTCWADITPSEDTTAWVDHLDPTQNDRYIPAFFPKHYLSYSWTKCDKLCIIRKNT